MNEQASLEPWIAQALLRLGIENPNPAVDLHRRAVLALRGVGAHAPLGQQLAAVRYVVRDEHRKAGARLAVARAEHEEAVRDRKIELLRGEEKVSVALATDIAERDAADRRREWLTAEQDERSLRLFLQAIAGDLENHRTDRADWRAADAAEAHGVGGGA